MLQRSRSHWSNVLALCGAVAAAVVTTSALAGCASYSGSGFMNHDGGEVRDRGNYPYDDAALRCQRDLGVWRPQIAGGYCEVK